MTSTLPPPPTWLGRAIIATGAVVLIVGMLVLVLRIADDGDPDLGQVNTLASTTSTTELATTTTEATTTTTTEATTSTTVKATTTTVKRATTTTAKAVTTTAKPATTTTAASGATFTANEVRYFSGNDGDFGGTALITNNTSSTKSGSFTIRLYRFDELVGTLRATKAGIPPNETVEVEFTSDDDYVAGVDRHEFTATAS